jgi:transposase
MRNYHTAQAFYQGGDTRTAIAQAFHVSSSTVSRVIKEYEDDAKPSKTT